jgi:hypothetical protein
VNVVVFVHPQYSCAPLLLLLYPMCRLYRPVFEYMVIIIKIINNINNIVRQFVQQSNTQHTKYSPGVTVTAGNHRSPLSCRIGVTLVAAGPANNGRCWDTDVAVNK